ncbi:MAG: hypothetical protein IJH55_08070 [Romboutsia sp.]|nr:hypothetical protein [Romboutsia sp.]
MIFDYLRTVQAMDTIDIVDIGNTCINAVNDDALEWYLLIETKSGWTRTTTFGPLKIDSNSLSTSFLYSFYEKEYAEKTISKTIETFINNPKYMITQVFEVDKEIAKERLNSIKKSL